MVALFSFISLIHICDVMMTLYKTYTGDDCSVQFHQFYPYLWCDDGIVQDIHWWWLRCPVSSVLSIFVMWWWHCTRHTLVMVALFSFISLIHICDVMMTLYKTYTGDGCSVQFHQFNPYLRCNDGIVQDIHWWWLLCSVSSVLSIFVM